MPITGRVADILNERELVINRGRDSGVKEGTKFKVMEPERIVRDPETREELGKFSREKIRVKVVELHDRYSIGMTYETYTINVGGTGLNLTHFGGALSSIIPRQEVTRVRTLRTDGTTHFSPMQEDISTQSTLESKV